MSRRGSHSLHRARGWRRMCSKDANDPCSQEVKSKTKYLKLQLCTVQCKHVSNQRDQTQKELSLYDRDREQER